MSAYRSRAEVQTPHLDRLAAEGMRFTRMRANATVCSPTRAALMSGRYADRVGVPGLIRTDPANTWGYFDPKVPTLANYLHGAGYHTAIVGKWNLGLTAPGTPNDRGFDFFHGSAAERARPNGVWRGVWGQAVNAFPVFLQPLARAFHANSHPVAARRDGGPTAPVI
eukprot:gene12981-17507_t